MNVKIDDLSTDQIKALVNRLDEHAPGYEFLDSMRCVKKTVNSRPTTDDTHTMDVFEYALRWYYDACVNNVWDLYYRQTPTIPDDDLFIPVLNLKEELDEAARANDKTMAWSALQEIQSVIPTVLKDAALEALDTLI